MAYVRSDGSFLYLDVPYAEFYVPKYYFEDGYKCAEDFGSTIKTIGIMDVGIFEGETLKEMKVLNIPSLIELYVTALLKGLFIYLLLPQAITLMV